MKRLFLLITVTAFLFCGCSAPKIANDKPHIVATNFICYDFARAVAGDNAEITMLIPPASDIHSFEPTALDIAKIKEGDLFIYVGGESDNWVEKILKNATDNNSTVLNLFDGLGLENDDDHSHETDEHIWTSPDNAIKIVNLIRDSLAQKDSKNKEIYYNNAQKYVQEIEKVSAEIEKIVSRAENKTLVIADRFPLKHFAEYYGLNVTAAFSSCDHETDIDLNTAALLLETVKNNNLKSVFITESGNRSLAEVIAKDTGAVILTLYSAQNISADDFKNGVTYVTLMKRNAEALQRGL